MKWKQTKVETIILGILISEKDVTLKNLVLSSESTLTFSINLKNWYSLYDQHDFNCQFYFKAFFFYICVCKV